MKKAISLAILFAILLTTGCSSEKETLLTESNTVSAGVTGYENGGTDSSFSAESGTKTDGDMSKPSSGSAGASSSVSESAPSISATTPATESTSAAVTSAAKTEPSTAKDEAIAEDSPSEPFEPHDIGGRDYSSDDLSTKTDSFDDVYEAEGDFAFADIAVDGLPDEIDDYYWEEEYPISSPQPEPAAGLLTGGEWRDNDHWADWNALYSSQSDWNQYKSDWRINYEMRIAVTVTSGGKPVEGAKVSCPNAISCAVTDNKGKAYLFYTAINGQTEKITAEYKGISESVDGVFDNASVEIELDNVNANTQKKLDFMIMCDTTGSMYDELSFLKEELQDIINNVSKDNANLPVRLSVNFYRDEGDEYIVREYPFTTNIAAACAEIAKQSADGGGDTPEAVHTALESAINSHDWDEDSVKILFLVLDAPPHSEVQIVDNVNSLIKQAAEMGIRIIPIASSGIDKSTEYLLRTMAFTTGGTYTFLTDDSGIGGSHIEPTVGAYNVEKLNEMMVRIVNGYLE